MAGGARKPGCGVRNIGPAAQPTLDEDVLQDILLKNLHLIGMALADAVAYREDLGEDENAEAYGKLADELEEWTLDDAS